MCVFVAPVTRKPTVSAGPPDEGTMLTLLARLLKRMLTGGGGEEERKGEDKPADVIGTLLGGGTLDVDPETQLLMR